MFDILLPSVALVLKSLLLSHPDDCRVALGCTPRFPHSRLVAHLLSQHAIAGQGLQEAHVQPAPAATKLVITAPRNDPAPLERAEDILESKESGLHRDATRADSSSTSMYIILSLMRIGMDDSTLKSVIAELPDGLIAVIKVTNTWAPNTTSPFGEAEPSRFKSQGGAQHETGLSGFSASARCARWYCRIGRPYPPSRCTTTTRRLTGLTGTSKLTRLDAT
ncbi:hypothetical protein OH76DRAFT_1418603 [Lentinus brumalis]|uniref:Uncharacterized protein n=1 Tax=Lentinus brumalis TaxID=2498619 RepID=A0A371D989_9APHY|nr:hypothetical protein OH76DRAFT_1418603 [Polyporus brumalis]